jgi:cell division transport system permease protein
MKITSLIPLAAHSVFLLLIGLFLFMAMKGVDLEDRVKADTKLILEAEKIPTPETWEEVTQFLRDREEVNPGSVYKMSGDSTEKVLRATFPELSDLGDLSALSDVIVFSLHPAYFNQESISTIGGELSLFGEGLKLYYDKGWFEEQHRVFVRMKWVLLIGGAFFAILLVYLLLYQLRLYLNIEKPGIRIMNLLGATEEYLKKPHLQRALFLGIVGSLIAVGILVGLFIVIGGAGAAFLKMSLPEWLILLGLIGLLGIIVPLLSTNIILNLYLKRISNSL